MSQHTFCWARYDGPKGIRSLGNDAHNRACPWHSDSLPSAPPCLNPLFVSGARQGSDALRSEARAWLLAGNPAFMGRFLIATVYPEVYPSDMPPIFGRLEPSHEYIRPH